MAALRLYREDPILAVWWGTEVECASAISRRERADEMSPRDAGRALDRLDLLRAQWDEVEPSDRVRRTAVRLLRAHALRAADALQLAAAIHAADQDPPSLPFVSLDDRLSQAADREGLPVVDLG